MCVIAKVAFGPRCFKWMFEMWSGPVALEFFRFLSIVSTCVGLKGGSCSLSKLVFRMFLVVILF